MSIYDGTKIIEITNRHKRWAGTVYRNGIQEWYTGIVFRSCHKRKAVNNEKEINLHITSIFEFR